VICPASTAEAAARGARRLSWCASGAACRRPRRHCRRRYPLARHRVKHNEMCLGVRPDLVERYAIL
jgi:hypothetical protein